MVRDYGISLGVLGLFDIDKLRIANLNCSFLVEEEEEFLVAFIALDAKKH